MFVCRGLCVYVCVYVCVRLSGSEDDELKMLSQLVAHDGTYDSHRDQEIKRSREIEKDRKDRPRD